MRIKHHSNQLVPRIIPNSSILEALQHEISGHQIGGSLVLVGIQRTLGHYRVNHGGQSPGTQILSVDIVVIGLSGDLFYGLDQPTTTSSLNYRFTPQVLILRYSCSISPCSFWRIFTKSLYLISLRFTRTGSLPSNSGSRSSTFTLAKDPPAMNRMLSVLMNLDDLSDEVVGSRVPQSKGRKSLCTPSVETPLALLIALEETAILSISSMKMIPFYSAFLMLSSSISRVLTCYLILFSQMIRREFFNSLIVASIMITYPSASVRKELLSGWNVPGRIVSCLSSQSPSTTSCSLLSQSSVPLYSIPSMDPTICAFTYYFTFSTSCFYLFAIFSLVLETAYLMSYSPIEVTSFPTYPTSVYLVASTLTNGASLKLANVLHNSVFPHPVGPSIRILLGLMICLISAGTLSLLNLFLNAIASTCLASSCPITLLFNSSMILGGVNVWNRLSLSSENTFFTFSLLQEGSLDTLQNLKPMNCFKSICLMFEQQSIIRGYWKGRQYHCSSWVRQNFYFWMDLGFWVLALKLRILTGETLLFLVIDYFFFCMIILTRSACLMDQRPLLEFWEVALIFGLLSSFLSLQLREEQGSRKVDLPQHSLMFQFSFSLMVSETLPDRQLFFIASSKYSPFTLLLFKASSLNLLGLSSLSSRSFKQGILVSLSPKGLVDKFL